MYIRFFDGDRISRPSIYVQPGASLGRRTRRPRCGCGFTGLDIFYPNKDRFMQHTTRSIRAE
jgi:hypothetical protein